MTFALTFKMRPHLPPLNPTRVHNIMERVESFLEGLINSYTNFYIKLESNFISEICIDSIDHILFALDSKSNIHIYKISNPGIRISKIQTLSFSTINTQCSTFIKFVFDLQYISNEQDFDKEKITTSSLIYRCVHLRQPPFDDFSAVRSIYSFYLTFETFLMCTDYGNSFRLWCMTRSLRCSADLYQESLKPFETLMGIYQIKNYFDSDEFSSFTGRTTLALSVLEDVWDSSYVYEVDLIKNGIYKRILISVAGDSNFNENRFLALHADLPELCLWDSRVYYQSDPLNWQLSLDLQDSKYIQNAVEELLVCTTRVITFYKSKLNDSSFMQLTCSLTEEGMGFKTLDFEQDLKLMQSLRFLILLTYQWLYIWAGIMTIDFKSFFQKAANNQLLEAMKATSIEDRNKYLTSSIQTYSKHPECLDLCWICNILVKRFFYIPNISVNYQPNAISLCLHVYAHFFKTPQTMNEDDFEHVWKESCEHGTDFHAKNLKFSISAALDRLEDENLSCQIFDWILNHDFSNMLIECSSMFLSDYLNDVDFNNLSVVGLKKARCLYEIYESRKNFLLASLQLFKIANARTNSYLIDNEIILLSLNERADYLHVSLAQVSLSPTSLENTTLVRNIKSKLESISVQRKINEELEIEINEKSQLNKSSNELDTLKVCQRNLLNNILTEKSMLQDIVLPCQLTTSYLFLVKILGEASVDYDHLMKIWNFLFQQVLDYSMGFYDKKEKNDSIKQFQSLILQYGNIKHCFSLEKLIVDFEIRISKTDLGHLWFPEMLATLSIVSYEDYAHLIQENIYNMISQEFNNSNYFDILCYLFDTYISLSSVIMHDLSKSSFANAAKMFNEYLEGKFHRLSISSSDKRQLITKTQSLTQIVISFYDNLIRQSSTIT
ncbi:hypothetical protein MXB_3388 [Myxobolus squamalis]|nr:hypothetical protein MXB_3388 [Myxobolus squamalis]